MLPRSFFAYLILFLPMPAAAATDPMSSGASKANSSTPSASGTGAALAEPLRELLCHNLPTPLYEASFGWGHTARVPSGIKWTGKGFQAHPQVRKEEKNDGTWRKVRITGENLPRSLVVELRNLQHPEPERVTFTVFVAFAARVDYEQQKWKAGVRLYAGSARARLRVLLTLDCELLTRLEWTGSIAPCAVFRLHVVRSNLTYRDLVVEHILGLGGDAAKLLGEALRRGIHQWRPSLERNLLNKANAAIEKAADTRDVRLGLGSLLR